MAEPSGDGAASDLRHGPDSVYGTPTYVSDEDAGPKPELRSTEKAPTYSSPVLVQHHHSEFIFHSLLEDHCLVKACEILNEGTLYTVPLNKESPEVIALGKSLYSQLSSQLGEHGMIKSGFDGEHLRDKRADYLQGLDVLIRNTAEDASTSPADSLSVVSRPHINIHQLQSFPPESQSLVMAKSNNRGENRAQSSLRRDRTPAGVTALPRPKSTITLQSTGEVIELTPRYASDFVELALLGRGGYGSVYLVHHRLDNQQYAVKKIKLSSRRLHKLQRGKVTEIEALFMELRTLATLEHSNVIRYYTGWIEPTYGGGAASKSRVETLSQKLLEDATSQNSGDDSNESSSLNASNDSDEDGDLSNHEVDTTNEVPHMEFDNNDDHIVFGYSSDEEQSNQDANAPAPTSSHRASVSNSSFTHTRSRRVSEELDDDVEVIPRELIGAISEESESKPLSTAALDTENPAEDQFDHYTLEEVLEPHYTLYIQTSLHPLCLSDFLLPPTETSKTDQSESHIHCFHLEPSLQLMLVIISGVQYLHDMGVVHRDLKPANIFLSVFHTDKPKPSGGVNVAECKHCSLDTTTKYIVPRIGDFGLVAAMNPVAEAVVPASGPGETDGEASTSEAGISMFTENPPNAPPMPSATAPKRTVGTALYQPCVAPTSINAAADVYSLGVILFETLWKFGTRMERHELISNLREGLLPPRFAEDLGRTGVGGGAVAPSTIVERLEDCLRGMLAKEEARRWSCKQVKACLERVLAEL